MGLRNAWMLLAIAACSGRAAPPPAPPPGGIATPAPAPPPGPSRTVKVTLADVGLEATSLDRTADPCLDFYEFACGGWIQANPIPAEHVRWTRLAEVDEARVSAIRTLLEEAAATGSGDARPLGDFWASCLDEAAIERAGLAPIRPLLDRLARLADARGWLAALVELHRHGTWVVWADVVAPDLADASKHALYLDVAGLGLADREDYLQPQRTEQRAAYQAHVARMLGLAGVPQPEKAAADVLAIEVELAKLARTPVERPAAVDRAALARTAKTVDWKGYWKGIGIEPAQVLVAAPRLVAELDALRAKFRYPQWGRYFTYHLLAQHAFALPRAFDEEARARTRDAQPPPRAVRCAAATEEALGEQLAKQYVARHLPASSQRAATVLADAILQAMHGELGAVAWLGDAARAAARAKLERTVHLIGGPARWRVLDVELRRDDFAGNRLRAAAAATQARLALAGTTVDRTAWPTGTTHASYDPAANRLVVPAGLLQPPFFGEGRSVAVNLGGLALVLGHELTHGFDDRGALFDGDGNPRPWWQAEDARRFGERAACLVDQYAGYEVLPRQFVNGTLTLRENVADLGGVKLAFQAYRTLRDDAAKRYVADGFDEDQQFFLAVAQAWCGADRPAEAQRRLAGDPQSPPKLRVTGALRNLPEFAAAFRCPAGTPMRPTNACTVW